MTTPTAKPSPLAACLLAVLLLLLAVRLGWSETLRENIPQKAARLAAEANSDVNNPSAPNIGPVWIAGFFSLAALLAGGASLVALRANALSTRRIRQFLLLAMIIGLLTASSVHAANRFNALVGAADIAIALLAAWTLALLCQDQLLGERGRNIAVAAIVGILAATCAKGLMQHYVEFPQLVRYVKEHTDEAMQRAGISNDPVNKYLFVSRVNSAEASGFGALSNVFATQIVPYVALLTAIILAAIPFLRRREPAAVIEPAGKASRSAAPRGNVLDYASRTPKPGGTEIPIHLAAFFAMLLPLVAGLLVLPYTGSRGGGAAAILADLAIIVGFFVRDKLIAARKVLLTLAILGSLAAAIGVVHYGRTHNGLPSKTLLFRWQYWSASIPIIDSSPLLGVGLNNFGDYYLQYKAPSSPEDVKDPHNFFVRLVSETGIAATVAIVAYLIWLLQGAFRPRVSEPPPFENRERPLRIPLIAAAVAASIWLPLHLLADDSDSDTTRNTIFYAGVGCMVFALALTLLEHMRAQATKPVSLRFISLAAVTAAMAMLLYDQVNTALVTGPVAMLFWMLLGLGDSYVPPSRPVDFRGGVAGYFVTILLLATSAASALLFFIPLARDTFPLDPTPHEFDYIRYSKAGDTGRALAALNQAIELSPRSTELLLQRIHFKHDGLHQPVADDIRSYFQLDRANARIRVDFALNDWDLPPTDRIAALNDALAFDAALPADEPKKLTAEQLQAIRDTITRTVATLPASSQP